MENKQQTKVTKQNKSDFFLTMYHHQNSTKDQLVDLDLLRETKVILVDCCGWHYKKLFPRKSIIGLETIKTVKQFGLDKTYFDRLIDDQQDHHIGWPSVYVNDCAVVFDRSPLLKYKALDQLSKIIVDVTEKYMPNTIILEQSLTFIDDYRLDDRFYNFAKFKIDGYVINKIIYDTDRMHFSIRFQKKFKQS